MCVITKYIFTTKENENSAVKLFVIYVISNRWMNDLLVKGFKKPLQDGDIYEVTPDQAAESVYDKTIRWV